MATGQVESTDKKNLPQDKLELEIAKLKAELADIGTPFFRKATFCLAIVPMVIALGSLFFQYLSNRDEKSRLLEKLDVTAQPARLEKDTSDFKVTKNNEEL